MMTTIDGQQVEVIIGKNAVRHFGNGNYVQKLKRIARFNRKAKRDFAIRNYIVNKIADILPKIEFSKAESGHHNNIFEQNVSLMFYNGERQSECTFNISLMVSGNSYKLYDITNIKVTASDTGQTNPTLAKVRNNVRKKLTVTERILANNGSNVKHSFGRIDPNNTSVLGVPTTLAFVERYKVRSLSPLVTLNNNQAESNPRKVMVLDKYGRTLTGNSTDTYVIPKEQIPLTAKRLGIAEPSNLDEEYVLAHVCNDTVTPEQAQKINRASDEDIGTQIIYPDRSSTRHLIGNLAMADTILAQLDSRGKEYEFWSKIQNRLKNAARMRKEGKSNDFIREKTHCERHANGTFVIDIGRLSTARIYTKILPIFTDYIKRLKENGVAEILNDEEKLYIEFRNFTILTFEIWSST